jgi:esterase/lipase superfamily enzyme
MHIEYHKWHSRHLGQDMELKVYGDRGKPVLIFPAQGGRFFEYEDFGMVEVCKPFIEDGRIRLVTVDSVDTQSWVNNSIAPHERALRHEAYEKYIVREVFPFIRQKAPAYQRILTSGCSMGGYHCANFFFRHPEVFDAVIALSGVYTLKLFIGDYMDDLVYYHVPLSYLPGLDDARYLEAYRRSDIVLCVGQGPWEEPMLTETRAMQRVLADKNVPAWIDIWGHDVAHDWPWWRQQMPYFLERLDLAPRAH